MPDIRVTFWGAARTVTGSMHLVEHAGRKILLDCGLYQGRRSESRQRNSTFPFEPASIDSVVLSHAHIDHAGNLPNLVRQGFRGVIYCTPATRDLSVVMLEDSAKIQEEDAAYVNKKRAAGEPEVQPLYTRRDADKAVGSMFSVPYRRPVELVGGVRVEFSDAGHILGSAMVRLTFERNGAGKSLAFTGDYGRKMLPILRDPAAVPEGDLLISEATYGNKDHDPPDTAAHRLAEIIKKTFDRGGKVLIPAFSVGRTQSLLYDLNRLAAARQLSDVPVYVDSPLAADATDVFRRHPECFDSETSELLEDNGHVFAPRNVRFTRSVADSKALNDLGGPCVIIAASGMCESGRIVHHLANHIQDERCTVLIIGFQAQHTLGRRLVEQSPMVRLFGREFPRRAEVAVLNGYSCHAGRAELLAGLMPLKDRVRGVRLVHAEPERAEAFAVLLRERGFRDVAVPDRGEFIEF
jgi:metallo-beta-lactamase family protein